MKRFLAIFLAAAMLLGNLAVAEGEAPIEVASLEEPAEAEGDVLIGSVSLEEAEEVPEAESDEVPTDEMLTPEDESGAEPGDVWLGGVESGERDTEPALEALDIIAEKTALVVGDALSLTVTCAPEDATTPWSLFSSDEAVATVDADGLVTAVGVGTATITALAGNGVSAVITFNVDPAPPAGIALNYSGTKLLAVGKKLQLEVAPDPEGAASWTSSKKSCATVSSKGLVTAKKVGTTTITVKTADGESAKVKIKVYDPKAVTKITAYKGTKAVSGKTLKMVAGSGVTFKVKAYNAAGKRLKYKVTWKSSKKGVATINGSGRLVTKGPGTTKITAVMKGKKTTFTVSVPKMIKRTYKGKEYRIVDTQVNPISFAKLTCANTVCTRPKYGGRCLSFCYYYVRCMMAKKTKLSPSEGSRGGGPNSVSFKTEQYGSSKAMMGRLYDLLNTGVPQILMVEAVTHPGSRHFVEVVGYRASVKRRGDLRPKDLLIIDSYDGKLESMDSKIDPVDTRVLFKQHGRYRIEAAKRR